MSKSPVSSSRQQVGQSGQVGLGELGDAVVSDEIGVLGGFGVVVLEVDGHDVGGKELCGGEASVAPYDEAAAVAHRDRRAPALGGDDLGEEFDLGAGACWDCGGCR